MQISSAQPSAPLITGRLSARAARAAHRVGPVRVGHGRQAVRDPERSGAALAAAAAPGRAALGGLGEEVVDGGLLDQRITALCTGRGEWALRGGPEERDEARDAQIASADRLMTRSHQSILKLQEGGTRGRPGQRLLLSRAACGVFDHSERARVGFAAR